MAIQPPVFVDTHTVAIDGKNVVVIEVAGLPLIDRPARYRGESYLRMADGDYRMTSSELRMLEVAKLHASEAVNYDAVVVEGTSVDDLDATLVKDFLAQIRATSSRLRQVENDEELLRLLAVTTASGELTRAGLYALGFYPQGHFPSLSVTVAQRLPDGSAHGRIYGLETFDGPVPALLQSTMEWLANRLGKIRRYDPNGSLREHPELPLEAVREAVANALVHRDLGPNTLGVGKAIDVRLMPDKLVIVSPGGLRDLTVNQLKSRDLARQEVNQRLYRMCQSIRMSDNSFVIEGEGGGVQMMLKAARAEGLPEPDLIDTSTQFTVKIWRPIFNAPPQEPQPEPQPTVQVPAPTEKLSGNAGVIAKLLRAQPLGMTVDEIAEASELSVSQARYALNKLRATGLVTMEGKRGSQATRYAWTGS